MSEVQGGEFNIDQTAEVIVFIGSALQAIDGALADGKIGLEDLSQLMLLVPTIGPALDGLDQVPKELGELDDEDLGKLEAKVDASLGQGAFSKVGAHLLKAGVDLAKAYSAIKEI